MLELYHGTSIYNAKSIIKNGIIISKGDEFTDNSQGFYLSESKEFAEVRAKALEPIQGEACVLAFEFDYEKAKGEINIISFLEESEEWKFFVAFNRLGKQYYNIMESFFPGVMSNLDEKSKYDVVIDIPADSRISMATHKLEAELKEFLSQGNTNEGRELFVQHFREKIMEISVGEVSALQYSFHTERSLEYLKVIRKTI